MSFRLRLTLFFLLIVVLPMVALAILVSQVASDSATGKADSRLNAGLRTATNLYDQAQAESRLAAGRLAARAAEDPAAVSAIESGEVPRLRAHARELARGADVTTVEIRAAGASSARPDDPPPVAGASIDLIGAGGIRIGTLSASSTTGPDLAAQIARTTGEQAALLEADGDVVAAPEFSLNGDALPPAGTAADFEQGEEQARIAASHPLGPQRLRIALLVPLGDEGFIASQPTLVLAVVAFFAVALAAVVLVMRSLQGYVGQMLAAARRIGEGDFSRKVPVSGNDEMAGLASEFNKMSDRLTEQMDQLRRQRVEIEKSVQRIGEAFASGLDRGALLTILIETAVGACEAEYGLVALSGQVGSEAEYGDRTDATADAALAAEERALREGVPTEEERQGAHALSSPIGAIGQAGEPVGAMTIARQGRAFTTAEREVFLYLLGQAAASVENVALHELVAEQAVTDELTGLPNKRAFQEAMRKESARAARFKHDISLVILDIDNFKQVNDTYGHLQGDEVLRVVGAIFAEESRGIDAPARYGGEEFVVALPETDVEGALEVAERIRERIEAAVIPLVEEEGEMRVTASLGTATAHPPLEEVQDLIAAADAALYQAKRTGKNKVVAAGSDGQADPGPSQAPPQAATKVGKGAQGRVPARRK